MRPLNVNLRAMSGPDGGPRMPESTPLPPTRARTHWPGIIPERSACVPRRAKPEKWLLPGSGGQLRPGYERAPLPRGSFG
jgi:hypothetical protein